MSRCGSSNRRGSVQSVLLLTLGLVVAVGVLLFLIMVLLGLLKLPSSTTTITETSVANEVRAVGKLVSTEYTGRDLVEYHSSYLGLKPNTVIAVFNFTVSVGVDLTENPSVQIDTGQKIIRMQIPHAKVLGREMHELRFIEGNAFFNPVEKKARDAALAAANERLSRLGDDLHLTERADQNVAAALKSLLSRDGYSVDVSFR